MESLAVAIGLWKQAQDRAFMCQQKAEQMRRRLEQVHGAHAGFAAAKKRRDELLLARDEAQLRYTLADMHIHLRDMEAETVRLAGLFAEAVAQSKLSGVLEVCPDGA